MVELLARKVDKHQRVFAIFMIALLFIQTILMAFTPHKASAASYPGKVVYEGQASWDVYIVGKFKVDGKLAFCMDHAKLTPATGYPMSQGSIYQNDSIRAILYYGAGGPSGTMGTSSREIVATSLALDVYANQGGNHDFYGTAKGLPEYVKLLNHGKNKDAPDRSIGFSNANLSTSVSGNIQKSQTTTFKADSKNSTKISVPSGVTLVNESTGSKTTGGTATVKGGEKIHFEAGLSYGQKYNTGKIKGSIGEYQPIVYMPQGTNSSGYQRLVHGIETDPVQTTELTVNFKASEGWIEITKNGNDTNSALSGATFQIKDGNTVVDTVTTGSNGKAKTKALLPNKTYSVTETKAPNGYTLNTTSKNIKVEAGKTVTTSFTNQAVLGKIEVLKLSEDGKRVQGVVYEVKNSSGKVVDTITTNKDGIATSKELPLGDYTVVEKSVPAPLILDKTPLKASIKYKDQNTPVVVGKVEQTNEFAKGKIQVVKQDAETGNTPQGTGTFAGAVFEVKDSSGKVVDTLTIKDGNKVTSKELPLGKYTVTETKAPNGYTINKTPHEVELVYENENTPLVSTSTTVKNEAVKGKIEITKQDTETGNTPQGTGTFVGAEFEVKDSNGKVVDKLTIKDGNKVSSKELPLGKYTVTETKAPNGYTINKTPQTVELTYKDQNTALVISKTTIKNEAVKGTIEITKQDVETGNTPQGTGTLNGAEFEIKDSSGKVVQTLVAKDTNKVKSKELPLGKYTVTETKAPYGYTINKTPHEVELTYKDQNTSLVSTSTTVKNDAVKGKIEIEKKDDDGKLIEGVTYDIQDSKGKVVDTIVTGKDGKATSKELVLGSYTVHEVKVPAPLIIDRIPIPVELKYANQTTRVVVEKVNQTNINAKGEIELHKVDYKNFKGVDGATYGLYAPIDKDNGELIQKQVTKNGGKAIFKDVRVGTYYIQEIKAPEGYELDKKKYHVTVSYINDETPIISIGMEVEQRRSPVIGTTASFVGLDKKEPNMTTLVDVVKYENLIAEKEYTVEGYLMDKLTGEPILIDGEKVTGSTTFVAESIDGEVEVEFVFDQSKLETKTVVVFEDLYHEDLLIATHHDINDVEQTVDIPEVGTSASFVELDKKNPNITTLVDVVEYNNLIPEKEYTVDGVLMNKETGKPVIIDGKEVTGSTTFVAEKSSGSVEVKFTFDKSKLETQTVVVFEDLYHEDILYAVHHDINDKEQTVDIPEIGTEASFVELDKKDPNMTTLVDIVKYENLNVGEVYTVSGVLMDKETNKPILIDDEKVTGETTFTPEKRNGEVEVEFVFDQSKLETDTVVVFEDLYSGERLIAVHHDINDKEQTVEIPGVGTTASFVKIEKENPNIATLVDVVKYENLIPGKEYTVEGILMDKETGEPIEIEVDSEVDENETEEETENEEVETTFITGKTTFTPQTPNGEVEVEFVFDKSKLQTDTVVVFEDLYSGERLIAVHHDINDVEQTVEIPDVKTEASFVELDKKDPNITTLVDVVHYEGLVVGKEYTVNGHLMNKETNEPILIDGEKVTGSTTFVAEETTGKVEVTFTFDQSKLETDTVVVFEDLYDGENLIAVHHDINDEEQTVEIPEVKTSASFVELDKEDPKMTTLVDVVYYDNLIVGEEYTVNGKLMDKETGKPVLIDGKEVTGTTTFVAESSEGNVEVEFTFDQTKLETDTVVVFEDLYSGERLIAVHHDINDIEQTVEIPKVKTEASFAERDTEQTNMITLSDIVKYENLIVGKEYTVNGKLMDKATGEPVIIDGKEVTGTTTFTAKKSEGEVEVLFTFDQSKLKTDTVVVFEDLYDGEKLIAVHHDINDKDQTVGMVKVEVIKKDSEDGKRLEGAEFTMYSKKGKHVLDVQVTDKDGYAYFNIVEGEEVVIKETKAPEGYKINKKQSKQKVVGEGKVITLEIENDKIPDNPLPNTATEIFNMLLIGAGLLLVGGFAGFYYFRKRKLATGVDELDQE